ncbi:hypothetical protein V498_02024 [Pseudogymnoascus sp. VKM F-4517 (FW-2822)]|nr:hypothetical protein V498_02024 [Pseudogymnoascus sp. VKM F-4517 (FW-2822)]
MMGVERRKEVAAAGDRRKLFEELDAKTKATMRDIRKRMRIDGDEEDATLKYNAQAVSLYRMQLKIPMGHPLDGDKAYEDKRKASCDELRANVKKLRRRHRRTSTMECGPKRTSPRRSIAALYADAIGDMDDES